MRVAVLSYPMLFQTRGGLSMKVQRTVDALCRRGIDARLIDPVRDRLRDFDLVHVFAGYNGNHRIIEQAKSDGLPVVLSTILNPPFSRRRGQVARLITRITGRLTRWSVTTSYRQLWTSLSLADHLVVLGGIERQMLVEAYLMPPEKITTVQNGIGAEFFKASPELFRQRFPQLPERFVLHTGLVGDVKNQLGLVKALAGTGVDVVLIGGAGAQERDYLAQCLQAGGPHVHHLGELPHGELIASACAASSLVAIPSRHEGMPNSILEALAADRPVVLTNNHTMDFTLPHAVAREVGPDDHATIRSNVLDLLNNPPPPGAARAIVASFSWDAVAAQLEGIYRQVSAGRAAAPATAA
jgi:glycosyltransferase involved in cell wall biosynthesis